MFGFDPHTKRNGQPRSRRVRLILSYVPDYVVIVLMAVLWGILSIIEPFHRDFSLTDKTIQYPNKPDSVPFYAAVLLCFVFPLVVILTWTGLFRRSFHDMNAGVLGLCLSLVLNMMITNTIKNLAGRQRPDFIDRCNLDKDNAEKLQPFIGMVTTAICRPTDKKVFWDGMRSFPSGHTSFSFAGFTFLSLWLAGHLHIGDKRGRAYKSFFVLFPMLAALLIGISRTKDYRHHWQDVLGAALLGTFMGWFGHSQYYPSPFSTEHDPCVPFPPRIPEGGEEEAGDVEQAARNHRLHQQQQQQAFSMKSFSKMGPNGSRVPVVSTGSMYSQNPSSSQMAPRIPAPAHGATHSALQSRESLVN